MCTAPLLSSRAVAGSLASRDDMGQHRFTHPLHHPFTASAPHPVPPASGQRFNPPLPTVYFPGRESHPHYQSLRCWSIGCAAGAQQPAPTSPPSASRRRRCAPVPTAAFVGQTSPSFRSRWSRRSRRSSRTRSTPLIATAAPRCAWADSLIGEAFVGRAPEVHWVLPPSCGRWPGARRASWATPTRWGRRCCARPSSARSPIPLRSSLRNLMAVVGGTLAMVPAALGFGRQADGRIRADLSLVAADARTGKVIWRIHRDRQRRQPARGAGRRARRRAAARPGGP